MARKLAAELDELRRSGAICQSVDGMHHPPHNQYLSASLPRSIHSKVYLIQFKHLILNCKIV